MSQAPADLEANKRLALAFIDALSSGDAGRILDLYTDDATVWTAGSLPISGTHPREAVVALCEGLLGAFPEGLRFEAIAVTAEGNRVAVEAEGHGIHASGQSYDQQYHFLLVVRDGKLSEIKEYFDTEHARKVLIPGDA